VIGRCKSTFGAPVYIYHLPSYLKIEQISSQIRLPWKVAPPTLLYVTWFLMEVFEPQ